MLAFGAYFGAYFGVHTISLHSYTNFDTISEQCLQQEMFFILSDLSSYHTIKNLEGGWGGGAEHPPGSHLSEISLCSRTFLATFSFDVCLIEQELCKQF